MSNQLINTYYNALHRFKQYGGSQNETTLEHAFISLVNSYAEKQHLLLVPQQFLLGGISSENAERIKRQNEKKISVIIGNPPYNANQANFNDFNKNREYREIDRRVKDTYVRNSTAQKTKVYRYVCAVLSLVNGQVR